MLSSRDMLTISRLRKTTIDIPTLFIEAANDTVLKPEMSHGMERYVTSISRRSVKAAHWVSHDDIFLLESPDNRQAMWERPSEVNEFVREWFTDCVFGREIKL